MRKWSVYAREVRTFVSLGLLRSDTDPPWIGGVQIVSARTRAEAVECCESDPFFVQGPRRGYELFQWCRAPCFGEVGTTLL
ncbi:MAG: hypothetical protein WBP48_15320 [Microbacterium sp.]